jgi:hypothetical protein
MQKNLFGNLQAVRTHQRNIMDEVHTGFVSPNVSELLKRTEFHTSCIASIPSLQKRSKYYWLQVHTEQKVDMFHTVYWKYK